jgi:hypothetical protein
MMQTDPLTSVATIVFGIGLTALIVIYIISIKNYISPGTFSFTGQLSIALINIVALVLYLTIIRINANSILILTAGFSGFVLGYLLLGAKRMFVYKNNVEIKRSKLAVSLIAIAYIASTFFNIFGGANLMALGIIMVFFATGIMIGSLASDCIKGANMENEIRKGRTRDIEKSASPETSVPKRQSSEQIQSPPALNQTEQEVHNNIPIQN